VRQVERREREERRGKDDIPSLAIIQAKAI
jgi:hypothetical protein